MSMYWAGYSGLGLYLTEEESGLFADRYVAQKAGGIQSREDFDETINEREPLIGSNGEKFTLVALGADYCEGVTRFPLTDDEQIRFLDTNVWVLFADHQPEPFAAAYGSEEELLAEMQTKIGSYLPDDFDWREHIGIIQYACYA